mmetsp:Transcript_44480/g.102657  ORF Transcript_44480/g.102657 Transcript_44480/m.102657 type:complete len:219 (-) Transcript_44480:333-989(-)
MQLLALLAELLLPGDIIRDTSCSALGLAGGLVAPAPTSCGNSQTQANGGGGVLEPVHVLRDPMGADLIPFIHISPLHSPLSALLGSDGFSDGLDCLSLFAHGLATRALLNRTSGSGHTPPVGICRCRSVGPGETCRLCLLLCTGTVAWLFASSALKISDTLGLSTEAGLTRCFREPRNSSGLLCGQHVLGSSLMISETVAAGLNERRTLPRDMIALSA